MNPASRLPFGKGGANSRNLLLTILHFRVDISWGPPLNMDDGVMDGRTGGQTGDRQREGGVHAF